MTTRDGLPTNIYALNFLSINVTRGDFCEIVVMIKFSKTRCSVGLKTNLIFVSQQMSNDNIVVSASQPSLRIYSSS